AEPSFPFRFEKILHDMFSYGERVMADRIRNPREDLLTTIANATLGDKPLSQSYLDGSWLLIIFAGNDTTRNSISGGVIGLNKYPEEYDKLRADHSLIPNMVAEIVRWQTPVIHMRRTALEDYELGGQRIKAGEKVIMWYLSGNRDESVFDDAEKLIIDRPNARQHVSFGFGVHRCMGNRLAEMQLRVLWEEIMQRFRKVEVVGDVERLPNNFIRGIKDVPVRLHPL
ncbi:MAG: cytochrome P450, partial [Pseudomonadales bacterium]